MNSLERVKAAIYFSSPDKVPVINFGKANSDVFPLITLPSKDWKPGYAEDEKQDYLFFVNGDSNIYVVKS